MELYDAAALKNIFRKVQEDDDYYSTRDYKINLNMTYDEYRYTLEEYRSRRVVNENTRTILHEYGHWLQASATPYGMYMECLLGYSNKILINLIRTFVQKCEGKIDAKLPLLDLWGENSFLQKDPDITMLLYKWLDLSIVRCYFETSFYEYEEYAEVYQSIRCDVSKYHMVSNYVHKVDKDMAKEFQTRSNIRFLYKSSSNFVYDVDEYERVENFEMAVQEYKGCFQISARSLYESFSTVLEWCLAPDEFNMPDKVSSEISDYYLPIIVLKGCLGSCSKRQLLYSCIAVFDIIFSPPIFPHCFALRSKRFDLCDFDISARFYSIVWILRDIGPIRDGEVIEEYQRKICQSLNWATPVEISMQLAEYRSTLSRNPMAQIFSTFQSWRLKGFWPFFDIEKYLSELSGNMISVPVLQLTDGIYIDHAISNEIDFAMPSLLRQFTIQVMNSESLNLCLPFDMDIGKRILEKQMREMLEALGISVNLQL